MTATLSRFERNGTALPTPKKASRNANSARPGVFRASLKKWNRLSARKRSASALGIVACFLLVLSLYHCTEALCLLSGSPVLLSLCLAIGIDVGMVASEVAVVVGRDTSAKRWSNAYVILAVLLSMTLNAIGNVLHAPANTLYQCCAVATGLIVPVLVFILGKSTVYLWGK